jgi:hypothetical protein
MSTMKHIADNPNPYAAPEAALAGPVYHASEYSAHLLRKGWIYREIAVSGPCPAVIEYDGRGLGFETVRVNGFVATRESVGFFSAALSPRFDFMIATPYGAAPARIEVKSRLGMFLAALRLSIDGKTVYSEGVW